MELDSSEVLQLIRPLYGLADFGDRWDAELKHHHISDLHMSQLATEPSFFYRIVADKLVGVSGCYVDDLLRAGDREFEEDCLITEPKFQTTPRVFSEAVFAGLYFKQDDDGVTTHMNEYIDAIDLSGLGNFDAFTSARAKLAWLVYASPDICSVVAKLSQVTEAVFGSNPEFYNSVLRDVLEYLRRVPLQLHYPRLDVDLLRVRVYADASFATDLDGSSQLGYAVFLIDASGRCALIRYRSAKSHRVCHSAMAAEACALAEGFDAAFVMKKELELLLRRPVDLEVITDSAQVFDSISFGSRTKEQRIQLDLAGAK